MPDINPPLLFGIDPDETWDYVPKDCRAAKMTEPVFILRPASLATSIKREALIAEITKEVRAAVPDAIETLRDYEKAGGKLAPLPEGATDAEKAEYAEKKEAIKKALEDWAAAWADAVTDRAAEEQAITEKYLSEGVAGWRGLPSPSGKMIDFEANKGRLTEVLRGKIASEICEAIAAGATLSHEEQVGLPLSQESQSA